MHHFFSNNRHKRMRTAFQGRLKGRRAKGFTLLELLVAMIIGSLIVVALLTLVVQLTETNQKDAARTQVQQDMQAAMDYVAQDLRSAVFVYNGECLEGKSGPTFAESCPGIVNYIPATINQKPDKMAVLAFWRTKELPQKIKDLCKANATDLGSEEPKTVSDNIMTKAKVPCLAGYSYSLVVYGLDKTNTGIWNGKARLTRYELSQFPSEPTNEQDQTLGFADPLESPELTFQQWPLKDGVGSRQAGIPVGQAVALVDFVDTTTPGATSTQKCDEFGDPGNPGDLAAQNRSLSPTDASAPPFRSFYACVRDGGIVTQITDPVSGKKVNPPTTNQDVLLVLKGNVSGQGGFSKTNNTDNIERISSLQTRVLVRGIVGKKD